MAGMIGGTVSGVACGPLENIMIQQQRFGKSFLATSSSVVQQFGLQGVFRGLTTASFREGLFTAG